MAENYRMNINRLRPKEGSDLALFLSGVVSDAVIDCMELGLSVRDAIDILYSVADSFSVDIEVNSEPKSAAAYLIEESLARGNTIEIPSLGIKIKK